MFNSISVSISLTTIIAVLTKLAFLLHPDAGAALFGNKDNVWHDTTVLIIAIFMIFFRGKMMHDDHQYFTDIEKGRYRKTGKWVNKFGLFLGYVSWILWAPAIYFLGDWLKFGSFMIASILVSTIWAVIDSFEIPPGSPRPKNDKQHPWIVQHYWILTNIGYITLFVLILCSSDKLKMLTLWSAIILLVILIVDWLVSKPIATIIEIEPQPQPHCHYPPNKT